MSPQRDGNLSQREGDIQAKLRVIYTKTKHTLASLMFLRIQITALISAAQHQPVLSASPRRCQARHVGVRYLQSPALEKLSLPLIIIQEH